MLNRQNVGIFLLICFIVLPTFLTHSFLNANNTETVLAAVGDDSITRAMVEKRLNEVLNAKQKQRIEANIGQKKRIMEQLLREIVHRKVLKKAAQAEGISPERYVEENIDQHVVAPTEDEARRWLNQNRDRLRNPNVSVADVRKFLHSQRRREAYLNHVNQLQSDYDVTINLEHFKVPLTLKGRPSWGPENAPVTLVEFTDFQCPYCKRASRVVEKIKKNYQGRVRFVYKQFPLSIHNDADIAAEASLCAHAQDQFWPLHDMMFADPHNVDKEGLMEKASQIDDLDTKKFESCLKQDTYKPRVQADRKEGIEVGVRATPTFFINGRIFRGNPTYEELSQAIEDELSSAQS